MNVSKDRNTRQVRLSRSDTGKKKRDMQLTPFMFVIVCPMLFLAGLVDAIGGGGGLISLPAYLLAGLPIHSAIATNKLSSSCGTALATGRFIRKGLVNFRIAVPSVIAAILGASLGAQLSLAVSETVMKYILLGILPLAAFFVLNRHLFQDEGKHAAKADRKTLAVCTAFAFIIGMFAVFMHRENIKRLRNGEEKKIHAKK